VVFGTPSERSITFHQRSKEWKPERAKNSGNTQAKEDWYSDALCITYYILCNEITDEEVAMQVRYEEVAGAADQLRAEGRSIGPTKIRELLGRGSFTTVQRHLAQWLAERDKRAAAEAEVKKAGPPEELAAEIQKLLERLWPSAIARAKEEMRPEFEAFQTALAEAAHREKEALAEINRLEMNLDGALSKAARAEAAAKQAAEANQRIIALQEELARLQRIEASYAAREQLVSNLERQAGSLQTVLDQNAALNARLEKQSAELGEARIQLAKIQAKLEVLTER
jgi:RNA binding exosome subunit